MNGHRSPTHARPLLAHLVGRLRQHSGLTCCSHVVLCAGLLVGTPGQAGCAAAAAAAWVKHGRRIGSSAATLWLMVHSASCSSHAAAAQPVCAPPGRGRGWGRGVGGGPASAIDVPARHAYAAHLGSAGSPRRGRGRALRARKLPAPMLGQACASTGVRCSKSPIP